MNVAVKVENVSHMCELQIHLMPIKESEALHQSHTVYEYFRSFFLGNSDAVAQRLEMLCKLPVDEANDVEELVDHVLGSDADASLLEGLCALLKSIQESAGVVKVREAILAKQEQRFGAESEEAGAALFFLGDAYSDLGDSTKHRDVLERALPIYEREHGSDGAEVADVLNDLGVTYMHLGDYAKQREVLERKRSLLWNESTVRTAQWWPWCDEPRERTRRLRRRRKEARHAGARARDQRVGVRPRPPGSGHHADEPRGCVPRLRRPRQGRAGARARDQGARTAATTRKWPPRWGTSGTRTATWATTPRRETCKSARCDRGAGLDHPEVSTLTNLGNSYGDLGDHAKKRDMLERAIAIKERAYGRDHSEVASTLANLGTHTACLETPPRRETCMERSLAIEERTYGGDHIELAITLWNLAEANGELGDTVKQREILERALVINESAYGPDHSETVDCREALEALINSPLHAAANGGNADAITRLLDDGAEADQANEDGATPLYVACEKATSTPRRYCWTAAPTLTRATRKIQRQPLQASYEGYIEIAQLLLDNGCGLRPCPRGR